MNIELFARYLLEFSLLYPSAVLCYLPMRSCLRYRLGTVAAIVSAGLTAVIAASSWACARFLLPSNTLLLPILLLSFAFYRFTLNVSWEKALFVFSDSAAYAAQCTLGAFILGARAEMASPSTALDPFTSLTALGLTALVALVYGLRLAGRVSWLVQEFHSRRVWRTVWILPFLFTFISIIFVPQDPATILVKRIQGLGLLLVCLSLLLSFMLTQFFYRIASELTLNARLMQENQVLSAESMRYAELRSYMEETALLRHDYRQHLRVLTGLAEKGDLEPLRAYLRQYTQDLSDQRPRLCANAAVDAIAGHYDRWARRYETPVVWHLDLPKELPMPEVDLCMLLGNLVENALTASQALPVQERSVRVDCRMLSGTLLGLVVENRYDEASANRRSERGVGLVSVEATVHRYHGRTITQTHQQLFSVNLLLNLQPSS